MIDYFLQVVHVDDLLLDLVVLGERLLPPLLMQLVVDLHLSVPLPNMLEQLFFWALRLLLLIIAADEVFHLRFIIE